jgi:pSer/pThr/pTyr-binding forkhead associated (FHA) protein
MSELRPTAWLIVKYPDGQMQEFTLEKDEFTIGKFPTNDVVIQDDLSISRRHAVIRRIGGDYLIEDTWSGGGTYVDGERIQHPTVLRDGQTIRLGRSEVTFRQGLRN